MSRSRLDVAFVVQGEGRGHMTQALATSAFLSAAGHRLVGAFLGTSAHHPAPRYFEGRLEVPVGTFTAPTLVPDRAQRGMSVGRTAAYNLRMMPRYVAECVRLNGELRRLRPDVVVNFFDLLGGFAHLLDRLAGREGTPRVAVAHAYLMHHGDAGPPPPGAARGGLSWLGRVAAAGVDAPLALSFDPLPDSDRIRVTPPLLRPGLEKLQVGDEGYLLAYALNRGYAHALNAWHACNPGVAVRCHVPGGAGPDLRTGPGFRVHDLDDQTFLAALAGCRAYIGTAGFEAVAEAHWLGKPVLAVPVAGHYEQAFNAADMARTGVARVGGLDDLDEFWRAPPVPGPERVAAFRAWVARAPERIVGAVEEAARRQPRATRLRVHA